MTFGAYRVFGCYGSTTSDIMLAAMERILADGADVLNMSIGSSFQWPKYPTAQARRPPGQQGHRGRGLGRQQRRQRPLRHRRSGQGQKVISAASFDNTHVRAKGFTISPDNKPIGYNQATGAPPAPLSGTAPLARTGTATSAADACDPLPAGSLTGKMALIRRGTCGFHIKAAQRPERRRRRRGHLQQRRPAFRASRSPAPRAITIPTVSITAG